MKIRWTIAAVGALALAFATIGEPLPLLGLSGLFGAVPEGVCDANAKPAPLNFTLKDVDNKDVKLASFKGKVVVVDFWATWCGPCKLEIPGFVDLQNRYGSKGVQFVGISVDDKLEQLKPYVAEYKMNYPVLQGLGHEDVQDAFGPIWGIPTTIVIGRDGKICRKHTGMATKDKFEQEIKSLL
jgi:thiol-disulfide isomerase/thioredoxin